MDRPSTRRPSLREGLLAEHAKLEALLDVVIGAIEVLDDGRAADVWKRFASALNDQLDAEDRHLVSALPDERGARVLFYEHRYIRLRVTELGRAAEQRTLTLSALKGLRDILRAHARNDDRLLYGWAESQLDDSRRSAVERELRRRLEAYTTPPSR